MRRLETVCQAQDEVVKLGDAVMRETEHAL
jgi:hypothetical protein